MNRSAIRLLLTALTLTAACGAQSSPAQKPADTPCPASNQNSNSSSSQPPAKPCTPPANTAKPSAADQFPFPGEAAPPANAPDAPAANAPTPSASHPPAAQDHPFPGDAPAKAGPENSSSSSSSSSDNTPASSSSSDDDGYDTTTPLPSTRRKPPKAPKPQTLDQRVDEDLRVAKFYLNDDNLIGAYNRAKDAVQVEPDYSETHFMLAQIAQKMKKKDEAIAEFKTYLKMDPDGDRTKEVKKALAELQ